MVRGGAWVHLCFAHHETRASGVELVCIVERMVSIWVNLGERMKPLRYQCQGTEVCRLNVSPVLQHSGGISQAHKYASLIGGVTLLAAPYH